MSQLLHTTAAADDGDVVDDAIVFFDNWKLNSTLRNFFVLNEVRDKAALGNDN